MSIEDEIKDLANCHAETLKQKIDERVEEMQQDDTSHFLIYRVLGVASEEVTDGSFVFIFYRES